MEAVSMTAFKKLAVIVIMGLSVASAWASDEAEDSDTKVLGLEYDKGFVFATADDAFSLQINGLLQVRYSYVDYDPMIRYNQEDYSNFFIRRARLYFSGHAGSPRFTYLFHIQLEPTQGINANDLWLEYQFSDLLVLGAGRYKIGYGLEFMNSGSALGMVERSIYSGETDIDLGSAVNEGPRYPGGGTERFGLTWFAPTGFATGGMTPYRSQGVQLRGQRGSDDTPTFEYQVGVWQGRSTTRLSNGGNGHLLSARVGVHPWGFVDWTVVGDLENSPRFKLAVLASAYTNESEIDEAYDEVAYDLAAVAHYKGWSLDAEWGTESYDFESYSDDFDREGWRVALGWYVLPRQLELRVRYAAVTRLRDPRFETANQSGLGTPQVWDGDDWAPAIEGEINETSAAASYSLPGWRNKVAIDFSRLVRSFAADPEAVIDGVPAPIAQANDQVDWRLRLMVQLVF
jgi:hypothetical protein